MKDQNPNEEFHRMVEDPMQAILAMRQQQQQQDHGMQGSLRLKAHIRRDMNILSAVLCVKLREANLDILSLIDSYPHFVEAPSALSAIPAEKPTPAPQVITNEEEYLATLSRRDKKRLLKHLLEQEERGAHEITVPDLVAFMEASKAKERKDKKKKDKSKKGKKSKKRKRRESSSSSESESESDEILGDAEGDARGEDRKSRRDKRKSSTSSKKRHHNRSGKRRRSRSRSRSRSRERDRRKDRHAPEMPASSSSASFHPIATPEIAPSASEVDQSRTDMSNPPQ
jgi:hypothetical protein